MPVLWMLATRAQSDGRGISHRLSHAATSPCATIWLGARQSIDDHVPLSARLVNAQSIAQPPYPDSQTHHATTADLIGGLDPRGRPDHLTSDFTFMQASIPI